MAEILGNLPGPTSMSSAFLLFALQNKSSTLSFFSCLMEQSGLLESD